MSTGTASRGLALQCSSYLSQSLRMGEERMRFWGCYHVTYITYTPSYITIHYYNYDVIQYWCNASKRYTKKPEEVRHACTNHYKFSALMSLRSRDNVQAKCTRTCSDSCTHVGPPLLITHSPETWTCTRTSWTGPKCSWVSEPWFWSEDNSTLLASR